VIRYFFIVRLFHSMHHAGVTGAQEEEYSRYCDDEQRSQPGWIGVQIVADIP